MNNFYSSIYRKVLKGIAASIFLSMFFSCEKQLEVDPPVTSINGERVFREDGNAIALVTGLYPQIESVLSGNLGLSVLAGLSADELTLSPGIVSTDPLFFFYGNNLLNSTPYVSFNWTALYKLVYICNSSIKGLSESSSMTPAVKKQLEGEAYFMRALCYYYLVTLYGDVPLITTPDYSVNSKLTRNASSGVWTQIIEDLKKAKALLSPTYLDGTLLKPDTERIRPVSGAASALLARAYLYTKDWANAELEATTLVNNTSVYELQSLDAVFLKNSREAIWQLAPINLGWNTEDGRAFIIPATGLDNSNNSVYLSNSLLDSFELGDGRRMKWIDSVIVAGDTYHYPNKYKSATYNAPVTEYLMVFRLAEQYLIRAEARAQQNNLQGAMDDLNVIRDRAALPHTTAATQSELLAAILKERRVEMFTEIGQRWLDLKRTGTIDAVMQLETPLKAQGAPWHSFQQLYPIPLDELQSDPNLSQNPGY